MVVIRRGDAETPSRSIIPPPRVFQRGGLWSGMRRWAAAIERELGKGSAQAVDSRRIEIRVPVPGPDVISSMMAKVENLMVPIHPLAKVVVNERTGTIVMGQAV